MAMGQVAGEAAAFAAQRGVSPLELPVGELKRRLSASGAIVPNSNCVISKNETKEGLQ